MEQIKNYLKKLVDTNLNYGRHIIKEFANLIQVYENVLDIGAGIGEDLTIYKKTCDGASLFALDFEEKNVKQLLEKGICAYKIDIERQKFPFNDEFFDVINANQILEHTKEIFWILHEVSRVLKIGGYLVIGVPNLASLHNRILLLLGKQPTCIKNTSAHVRGFTKGDIIELLNIFEGGYDIIKFKGSNFYPFPSKVANFLSRIFPELSVSIFLSAKKRKKYSDEYIEYLKKSLLETNFHMGNSEVEGGPKCT
ncbi:MAG: class I SAM-dependent methyltransferase [Candidatus Aenigmarchaeota archaeon]|nr:class I SAM-dependent methyltransferase [Candidatus Aenigmarchaeota archaeon]MDW8149259.1 class I SAM-dependent methyltransferase [Candidatus Aenigmarchaeota archaeon]